MKARLLLAPAALAAVLLSSAAPANAAVPHTVEPGETLWSIAAASNFTTRTLAAYNGLPESANVVIGSTIQIPSEAEGAAALGAVSAPATAPAPSSSSPPAAGSYTAQPGDTLSGIAARSGVSTGQVAFMNGIDPSAPLLVGTVLKLPTGAPGTPESSSPTQPPAAPRVPDAEPYPTPGHVTSGEVASIASAHGVPPSLATAVAYQESGFNNGLVSSANARGVMQVLPGTWNWIQDSLASRRLDPSSPTENVYAGVLFLRQLLNDTGGDEAKAIASYYQGLSSVQQNGMLPETEQYVASVQAHRARFGGR